MRRVEHAELPEQVRLGKWLAERRERAGLTQAQLGALWGYSQTMVAKLERGGSALGFFSWVRVCEIFKVRMSTAARELEATA